MNRAFALLLASASTTACGGRTGLLPTAEPDGGASPLEGTWLFLTPTTPSYTEGLTFGPGGAFTETVTRPGCSGGTTVSGPTWSATAREVTVRGGVSCSGAIECAGVLSAGCGTPPTAPTMIDATCRYVLSQHDDVLTLGPCTTTPVHPFVTVSGGIVVLNRQ